MVSLQNREIWGSLAPLAYLDWMDSQGARWTFKCAHISPSLFHKHTQTHYFHHSRVTWEKEASMVLMVTQEWKEKRLVNHHQYHWLSQLYFVKFCVLPHIILALRRVQQVSQVSRGLRGQQGIQEGMEMRDHPDSQDPEGTQGQRHSIPTPSVYWGYMIQTYTSYAALIMHHCADKWKTCGLVINITDRLSHHIKIQTELLILITNSLRHSLQIIDEKQSSSSPLTRTLSLNVISLIGSSSLPVSDPHYANCKSWFLC